MTMIIFTMVACLVVSGEAEEDPTSTSVSTDTFQVHDVSMSLESLAMVVGAVGMILTFISIDYFNSNSCRHQRLINPDDVPVISACKNPNCARCQRYKAVQSKARARVRWIVNNLKTTSTATRKVNRTDSDNDVGHHYDDPLRNGRIETAVLQESTSKSDNPWQAPTLLFVADLITREFVTDLHEEACRYMREYGHHYIQGPPPPPPPTTTTKQIVLDAIQYLEETSTSHQWWTTNDSPKGRWEVLQILNQGVWNRKLLALAKAETATDESTTTTTTTTTKSAQCIVQLLQLVQNIPGLLDGCLFGNVMISKIYQGTTIEPHCGPTNVRHRLQFLLERPKETKAHLAQQQQQLTMKVGKSQSVHWCHHDEAIAEPNPTSMMNSSSDQDLDHMFVFDDSFVHAVTFPNEIKSQVEDCICRTVLIADLWHPDLTSTERTLLMNLYPPMP